MIFCMVEEAANKTMEESLNTDETAFSTFEMRQSRRGTMSKRSTLGRRSVVGATAVVNAKSPPRPAPASVTYSDDDTVKGYDENPDDSSELTEKPTDLSSTASEVTFFFLLFNFLNLLYLTRILKKINYHFIYVYKMPKFNENLS